MEIRKDRYQKERTFWVSKWGHKGHIYIAGYDYGPKGLKEVEDLGRGFAIWKTFGHQYTSGIGMTAYAPPHYFLVRVVGENEVVILGEIYNPGHEWRKAIRMLKDFHLQETTVKGE